jgi:FtsZ-interacting cell division protein ZipA
MVLPGRGDPVERFDMMIATARDLAQTLDADLLDERGSSWSIQRERYIREEIIEYRYQLEHA